MVIWRVWIWYCMQIRFKNTCKPTGIPAQAASPWPPHPPTARSWKPRAVGSDANFTEQDLSQTSKQLTFSHESANKKSSLFDFLHLVHFCWSSEVSFFSIKNSLKKGSPWNTMFHPLDKRDPSWESHTHKTKVRKNNLHQIIQGKHPATTNGFTQQYHQSSPFCVVLNRWTLYSKGRETCSRNWRCLDWNIDDRIISMMDFIWMNYGFLDRF